MSQAYPKWQFDCGRGNQTREEQYGETQEEYEDLMLSQTKASQTLWSSYGRTSKQQFRIVNEELPEKPMHLICSSGFHCFPDL